MKYNTSYKEILENCELWNNVIPESIETVKGLSSEQDLGALLVQYIKVLHAKREFNDSYSELDDKLTEWTRTGEVDTYTFHRLFGHFITDSDKVLDVMDKLFKNLKKVVKELQFNRKDGVNKWFNDGINKIRNSILHEGILTIYSDKREIYNGGCHANTGTSMSIINDVKIDVHFKEELVESGTARTYMSNYKSILDELCKDCSRLIREKIDELIEKKDIVKKLKVE